MKYQAYLVLLLILFTGCAHSPSTPPRQAAITKTDTTPLSRDKDSADSMKKAVQHSLDALAGLDAAERFTLGNRTVTVHDLETTLALFLLILERTQSKEELIMQVRKHFDIYEVPMPVLFTGYYEPELTGSFEQTEHFRYPLYRRPPELDRMRGGYSSVNPALNKDPIFYSRKEIDTQGILSGRGLELLYLDDPVELFFLHIQGAGAVRLEDGRIIYVQYDGSNGRPYRSIGKILIEEGKLRSNEASLPGIKTYLNDHPEEQEEVKNRNERYIFFKISDQGTQGVLDMPLTPYRSLATDPTAIPVGSLCYYKTRIPKVDGEGRPSGWRDHAGYAVSQDIGSAIQGLRRADLFFGTGPQAAAMAGHMMSEGKLYILLQKTQ